MDQPPSPSRNDHDPHRAASVDSEGQTSLAPGQSTPVAASAPPPAQAQPGAGSEAPDARAGTQASPLPEARQDARPDTRPDPGPAIAPGPARRRRRAPLLGLLVAGVAIAALAVWHPWSRPAPTPARRGGPGGQTQPQAVGVASARTGDMDVSLNELGTVTPLATVTVRTQINGILTQVAFTEGQMVHRGDFLAQIDPRPYQALLAQYEGNLARDQATLANNLLDLARYQKLNSQDSIARQTVDTAAATVRSTQGTVKADQAQIDTEKLNLVYCHITSPVDGRVGLRQVDAGNYVTTTDTTGLVVVTQLQPISVIFTLPEDAIPRVQARLHAGAALTATAWDRADSSQLDSGTLLTLDNQIDTTTGTVRARASFPNPGDKLFPNQFVNVHLLVDTLHGVILVPNAAIQRGTPGTFVFLIGSDDTVSVRPVKTGVSDSQDTVIASGLEPGDRVVVDGADRLRAGAKVTVPADHKAAGGAGGTSAQPQDSAKPASDTTDGQRRHRRQQ